MIKDLFTGSLGKLNNHGGSRIYTTPNTILVPPEYEVEIPHNYGDFVNCSLDGRLWLLKKSDKYSYVIVLKWDKENKKLAYHNVISLSKPVFLARGLDWILTDQYVIFAHDEAPYVVSYKLSETINLGSYNDSSYCLLPKITIDENEYQLIGQYLFSRKEKKYSKIDYFWPYGDGLSTSFNQIALTLFSGQLIGSSGMWFAKCALVPTVLTIDNEPVELCLFFFTFKDEYNKDLVYDATNVYSFLSADRYVMIDNQYSSITCKSVKGNYIVFLDDNNDYTALFFDENGNLSTDITSYDKHGKLYLDIFTNKIILIDKNYLSFRNNDKVFNANGLSQWINPVNNEKFEGITENAIIAKLGDDILVTYPNEGFHRELLRNKQIALTPYVYDGYRLSLGIKDKKIGINKLKSNEINPRLNLEVKKIITFEITDYNLENYYGVNITYNYIPKGQIEVEYEVFGPILDNNTIVDWAIKTPYAYTIRDLYGHFLYYVEFGNPTFWNDTYWTGNSITEIKETNGEYIINIKYYDKNKKNYITKHVMYDVLTNSQTNYEEKYGLAGEYYPQTKQGTVKIENTEITDDIYFTVPDYIDTNSITFNSQNFFIRAITGRNFWVNNQRYFYFDFKGHDIIYCVPQEQCTSANITDIVSIYENDNSNLFIFHFSDNSDMAIRAIFHKELIDDV